MLDRYHLKVVQIAPTAAGPHGPDAPEDDYAVPRAARAAAGDINASLALARRIGPTAPLPGRGRTHDRWKLLATLAASDLTVARVIEPHLDALAILDEAAHAELPAPSPRAGSLWGVFAGEGPEPTVTVGRSSDGSLRLSGVKPWCGLADRLTDALVTATTDDGQSVLVAVNLRAPGVTVEPGEPVRARVPYVVPDVPGGPIRFDDVPAVTIGPPGWYVDRRGFWWGGIGLAACWYGGSVGLARAAWQQVHRRRSTDVPHVELARIDLALHTTRTALADAAVTVDDPRTPAQDLPLLAQRVRAVAADGAEVVLREAGHLLKPGPVALDTEQARRVADMTVYIRQHPAERDLAGLSSSLAGGDRPPW
ncbi:MAG: acyl-CoA dehydrogenase [bacterium]